MMAQKDKIQSPDIGEEKKEGGKKPLSRKKALILLGVGAALLIALLAAAVPAMPAIRYQKARSLLLEGQYDQAIAAFEALGDYRDSGDGLALARSEQQYAKADQLYQQGNFQEALPLFETLGAYRDCPQRILDCRYGMALDHMEAGDFREALEILEAMPEYGDRDQQIETCRTALQEQAYQQALSLEDPQAALQAYAGLSGYKDSDQRAAACSLQCILQSQEGDLVPLGRYEQDGDPETQGEVISWRVLKKTRDRVLLVSDRILAGGHHADSNPEKMSWETSYVREFLNGEFLSQAFTEAEQALLLQSEISNEYGRKTQDTLFLLSTGEVKQYLREPGARVAYRTEAVDLPHSPADGTVYWLLRSMGDVRYDPLLEHTVCFSTGVSPQGEISPHCFASTDLGLRPAVWVGIPQDEAER